MYSSSISRSFGRNSGSVSVPSPYHLLVHDGGTSNQRLEDGRKPLVFDKMQNVD